MVLAAAAVLTQLVVLAVALVLLVVVIVATMLATGMGHAVHNVSMSSCKTTVAAVAMGAG